MATIRQRNKSYYVIYLYTDEKGEQKQKWESYKTMAEAKARKKEIEYRESIGTFSVPVCKTFNDLLNEYISLYGKNNWSMSTYRSNCALIDHYIRPKLGQSKITDINTRVVERFYQALLKTNAVPNNARKPKQKLISARTVRDVHKILHGCFNQAKKWGMLERNPAEGAMLPKHESEKREIWTSETLFKALNLCDDPRLALALNLAFCCSLRIGELLGLTWDCVDITQDSIDCGSASVFVKKELQRVQRAALETLENKDVQLVFPATTSKSMTVLVLKAPKTESSVRKVFMPKAVAHMLAAWKDRQDEVKNILGSEYKDYNLVFAGPLGLPTEASTINGSLQRLIRENDLPPVVFHSFRHASVTYKLKLNGGDIKAVQGDTGHAQAKMVTEVYSHILDDSRQNNAQLFQETFYETIAPEEKPALPNGLDPDTLAKLLARPEVTALLASLAKSV